ncbi:MAG: alkaline phosphatase family protein [Chitinophagaceae bacterium]|nr:alkaline phosphatase family protein [Chitinophagaceae bacterium]
MKQLLYGFFFCLFTFNTSAQQKINRPKLVVGIVVDQMRWDFIYRFYERYKTNGGLKRILREGFTCENTLIPYMPSVTACGHSCIFSGSVPAISGITGNAWWDRQQMRSVYCTEDKSVNTLGSSSRNGQQSPRNLLVTTICDELRLATNFRSKVIGIALKDRGGILSAGHSANAAYWYDNTTGNWITSSYYMNELPGWVKQFNDEKWVDKYYAQGWNPLYPVSTYHQSTADEKPYEGKPFGNKFPYDLKSFIGKDYGKIATTPMGNSLTFEFSKRAVKEENLGKDDFTDFLTVSFSSTDYIGHTFGPNSVEAEDGMLRFDAELGEFMDYLDKIVGKNQYTLFLTADHGVAHIPEFNLENKLPGGRVFFGKLTNDLNKKLEEKFNMKSLILSDDNYQIHLNHHALDSARIGKKEVADFIIRELLKEQGIDRAFLIEEVNLIHLPETLRKSLNNGYHPARSGDIQIILKPGFMDAIGNYGTTHGLWNPYDTHIPLLWYGWGIKKGFTHREVYMTDIAPTVAALLKIQEPNGCIGKVIYEVIK